MGTEPCVLGLLQACTALCLVERRTQNGDENVRMSGRRFDQDPPPPSCCAPLDKWEKMGTRHCKAKKK